MPIQQNKGEDFEAMISFEKMIEQVSIQGFHSIYRWERRQIDSNLNF